MIVPCFLCSLLLGSGIVSGTFRLLQKARSFHPASVFFTSKIKDGWGKKTLQRLANDLKNEYTDIKGFSIRNMQCMMQFYNEYNKELTMCKMSASAMRVCQKQKNTFNINQNSQL